MSISTISSNITRVQKEISDLHHRISLETKKETDCNNRIGQIKRSITKNISISSLNSKNSEIERKSSDISKIQTIKAELHKRLTDKEGILLKLKQDLAKEEENERKKRYQADEKERKRLADLEKRQQREQLDYQKKLQAEIQTTNRMVSSVENAINKSINTDDIEYDLFISHASEDKDEFVRPLAETLEGMGVKVWYDEFTLKVGDSLRQSIDRGLVNSRFGTVILSPSFCSKNWTQYELDAMVAKEMHGHRMILPIWHRITKYEVINFSPTLADKLALNTSINSIKEIAEKLAEVVQAQ